MIYGDSMIVCIGLTLLKWHSSFTYTIFVVVGIFFLQTLEFHISILCVNFI